MDIIQQKHALQDESRNSTLILSLDSYTLQVGTSVVGTVLLSLMGKEATPLSDMSIRLLLQGSEYAVASREETEYGYKSCHTNIPRIVSEHSVSTFLCQQTTLTEFQDTSAVMSVEPGNYEYPFTIDLPENLPSSIRCQSRKDPLSFCEIRYQVTAYFGPKTTKISTIHNSSGGRVLDCKSSRDFSVIAMPRTDHESQSTPLLLQTQRYPIISCLPCRRPGYVTLGLNSCSKIVFPNSSIQVGIVGCNESRIQISHLLVQLKEMEVWNVHGRKQEISKILAEHSIPVHDDSHWQGFGKLQRIRHVPSAPPHEINSPIHPEPSDQCTQLVLNLIVPRYARVSYAGSIINIRHEIVVSIVSNSGCIAGIPELSATIDVVQNDGVLHTPRGSIPVLEEDDLPTGIRKSYEQETAPAKNSLGNYLVLSSRNQITIHSLQKLLAKDLAFPAEWLEDPKIATFLRNLTPDEYVDVVRSCREVPKLARQLAIVMDDKFQCSHVLACIRSLPTCVRMEVLRQVAPLASDLNTERSRIEQVLDDNELLHFLAALQ